MDKEMQESHAVNNDGLPAAEVQNLNREGAFAGHAPNNAPTANLGRTQWASRLSPCRRPRFSRIALEQVCSKGLAPVPLDQLRQLKGRWVSCGDGSCTRAVCSAWIGRRFGKGGFCTICVRASCTGWGGWTGA